MNRKKFIVCTIKYFINKELIDFEQDDELKDKIFDSCKNVKTIPTFAAENLFSDCVSDAGGGTGEHISNRLCSGCAERHWFAECSQPV